MSVTPEIKEVSRAAVDARMSEIYLSISDTIQQIAASEKARSMSGPEALRHVAALLTEVATKQNG